MPVPMPFEENGVRVNFPDANNFRLSDCRAYQAISGQGVKEMDIGWWDLAGNTLWLVELKGYYNPANPLHQQRDLSDSSIVSSVLEELFRKSVHTICQISTGRAGTQACTGGILNDTMAVRLVHLIRTMPGQDAYLNPLQDDLRAKLRPYIAIYNIASVVIVSYDHAVANNLLRWII